MYYPIGLPKRLKFPGINDNEQIRAVVCNRDRILFAILSAKSIWIWFSRVSKCLLFVLKIRIVF